MRYVDRPGPLAIAHRGGAGLAAENTLGAFHRSYALGVRYLETDVRITSDGRLVAFHDARLGRVTRASGPVHSTDFARRVCVAAARGSWLRRLQELIGPELCTALPWRALARLAAPRAGGRFGEAGFAHVPLRLGRVPIFRDDLVARAHDAGVRVIVWTVNEPDTMHRLLDNGVDGIITDRPDLLREVLVARGQWHTPDSYGASPTISDLVS